MMRHISNHHSNHPDAMFSECGHSGIEPSDWIKIGKTPVLITIYVRVKIAFLDLTVPKVLIFNNL